LIVDDVHRCVGGWRSDGTPRLRRHLLDSVAGGIAWRDRSAAGLAVL
jgi:hypothetical protein